jgi:hypothetical protein
MTISKPLAKRRALRALAEGARATLDLLADVSGRSVRILRIDAEREGWQLDGSPLGDIEERLRALGAMLLEQMEAAVRRSTEEGGKIDKTEVDAMTALVRGIEKVGEILRPLAVANEKKKDEDLARLLDRIDERIIELAKQLAIKMVEEGNRD